MILLTRLNGSVLAINNDLIRYAEATPDTTLTLMDGEKLVVRESLAELVRLVEQQVRMRARELAVPSSAGAGEERQ